MTVRPVQASDMNIVLEWASQEHLSEYFRRYPPAMDWSGPESFLRTVGIAYIAEQDGDPVGLMQLYVEDIKAKIVNLGMMVDKRKADTTRTSYEMCIHACEYVFVESGFNKLMMRILAHREKLSNRMQTFPWKHEGTVREACMYNGKLTDEILLGLLKSEYLEWKSSL